MAITWKVGHDTFRTYPDGYGNPAVHVAKPTWDGKVLSVGHVRTDRIMSDVWATATFAKVWDGTNVVAVDYALDDMGLGHYGHAVVDATPDVVAAAAAWTAAKDAAAAHAARVADVDRRIAYARVVSFGKDVTVVRGRKVKVGSKGRVFWMGTGKFGPRVGLELTTGDRVFTALSNVEVTNPDDDLDIDALMRAEGRGTGLAAAA